MYESERSTCGRPFIGAGDSVVLGQPHSERCSLLAGRHSAERASKESRKNLKITIDNLETLKYTQFVSKIIDN